jgi:large subunit ribosomal protein L6
VAKFCAKYINKVSKGFKMSRIGKLPISIPSGVTITVDNDFITVKGPKGELQQFTMPGIAVEVNENELRVTRASDEREHRSKHGLMRTLISNMVEGVTTGFSKKLEINGVGFRVALAGTSLKMSLGFSHEVIYPLPQGIQATVEQNTITISGISKQLVGQVAAEIRALKKPEPYKGKGIKYADERILRKSGKSGKD